MKWRAVIRVERDEVDSNFELYVNHYTASSDERWENSRLADGRGSLSGGNWFWVEVDDEDL